MSTLTTTSFDPNPLQPKDMPALPFGQRWDLAIVDYGAKHSATTATIIGRTRPPLRWWQRLYRSPGALRNTPIVTGYSPGVGRASAIAAMNDALETLERELEIQRHARRGARRR